MQDTPTAVYAFHEFAQEAGLGRMIWSRASYLAGTYYHYIVAAFTAGILLSILPQRVAWTWALAATLVYLMYVILRKTLIRGPQIERRFYHRNVQFVRAHIGLLGITFLIAVSPDGEHTSLWLLYVLMILLTSKHCNTTRMAIVVAESSLALVLVRLHHGVRLLGVLLDLDLWADFMLLGLLSFILHYLVRNIQARDETIAAHRSVNALARDVDMATATGARQWEPTLTVLIRRLEGDCASAWMYDPKTRQLRLSASVRRNSHDPQRFDLRGSATGLTVPLDGSSVIAFVARTGQTAHTGAQPSKGRFSKSDLPSRLSCNPLCADACVELAAPVNTGIGECPHTAGVLSIGFRPGKFHEQLVSDYENFMQGLVSQAKPILAYAQRLEELGDLQEATWQVWRNFEQAQVLESILDTLTGRLGFEFALVSLVDDDTRTIRAVKGRNVPDKWLESAVHPLDSNDICADTIRTGKTETLVGWDERFDRQIWTEFGHEDMVRVFMPIEVVDALTRQERNIGVVEAGYRRTNRAEITLDQLRMLDAFKSQIGMAIEHARLLERMQKRADVLTSLHRVGQDIAAARQTSPVLKEIAHSAKALLDAHIVMVYRYHRESNTVDQPVIAGEFTGKYRLNLDLNQDNILTWLLRETRPYYSPDAPNDLLLAIQTTVEATESGKPKTTFVQLQNIKSFAGIPLVADGETVGVMFVNYRRRRQFDADDRQAHELFAQQAAVAIKNAASAELARDLIVQDERHHLSRELHDSISQLLFGITLKARNVLKHVQPNQDGLRAEMVCIHDMAHQASNEVGLIIDDLGASPDDCRGLVAGLEEHIGRIKAWYEVEIHFEHDLHGRIPREQEMVLVRFAREGINNAVRHARCRTITVRCKSDVGGSVASVHDDGIGFDPAQSPPGRRGLWNMHELAKSVGGSIEIYSARGAGATVSLHIPSYINTGEP